VSAESLINVIFKAAVFGLVFSVWGVCVVLWVVQYARRLKTVQKRLGIVGTATKQTNVLHLWRQTHEADKRLKPAKKETFRDRAEKLRQDAGWNAPAQIVILVVAIVAILAFVATYALGGRVLIGLAISATTVILFWLHTKRQISKRTALFERQFVDSLGIAARALRAGHPLVGAFQLAAEEVSEPLGTIFQNICQEQTLGLDLQDSIRRVATNSRNDDLKLFATAVAIQLESGGNLAELMDSLAVIMRTRMRLNRRVRIITAQTQMSKRILIAMPLLVFVTLNMMAPEYTRLFYSTWPGKCMLVIAAVSVLFGAWLMSRLSVLRF